MRFSRRSSREPQPEPTDETGEGVSSEGVDDGTSVDTDQVAGRGPFDESEVDLEAAPGLDLGSLVLRPTVEAEVRIQVDEESGQVLSVLLVNEEAGLELRAFAASRGGSAWDEIRPQIVEETRRVGGQVSEQDGPFGPELFCVMGVQTPEGEQVQQPSRVLGYDGPRWFLRGTLLGQPAVDPEAAAPWEETFANTVVRRGQEAMAPGSPLEIRLPPEARRAD